MRYRCDQLHNGGAGSDTTMREAAPPVAPRNRLLARLQTYGAQDLLDSVTQLRTGARMSLPHTGPSGRLAYFPESAAVCLLVTDDEGRTVEVGTIGMEGCVGLPRIEGRAPWTAMTLTRGTLYRMDMRAWERLVARSESAARALVERYVAYRLFETLTLGACAMLHQVEQRLCRLILRLQDRTGDACPMTQELLALMLGVRRATITLAMQKLQEQGLVEQRRSLFVVRNRPALEYAACGCYRTLRARLELVYAPIPRVA